MRSREGLLDDIVANLNVRVDDSIKAQADDLFASLGMNTTTAVNVFLRQAIQYGGIPFDVRSDIPNAETIQAMNNIKNGIGLSRAFTSVEELMEDLNADD